MPNQYQILLQIELHRSRLPNNFLQRLLLLELLNQNLDHQLTLVCAPGGFGKPTLISNWLERLATSQGGNDPALSSAWLSLDENERDFILFLRYFIIAIRTIFYVFPFMFARVVLVVSGHLLFSNTPVESPYPRH